jgi:hypothetical protein
MKRLASALLTAADAAIYTVPALTKAIIKEIWVVPNAATKRTIFLNHVPAAGASSTTNALLAGVELDPSVNKKPWVIPCSVVMEAGDILKGYAGAANEFAVQVYGIEEA